MASTSWQNASSRVLLVIVLAGAVSAGCDRTGFFPTRSAPGDRIVGATPSDVATRMTIELALREFFDGDSGASNDATGARNHEP